MASGKRIVLATFGSLGDLHPILAVALGLKERGHRPLLVTQTEHKAKVDAVGVDFAPLRPALADRRWLGPRLFRVLLGLAKRMVRPWCAEVFRLRAELGLSRGQPDPLFDGQWSPGLNLALFSRAFARPQPDWPTNTIVTGFPFFDRGDQGEGMAEDLRAFLDAGPPPVVFTLGSSGVYDAGSFYRESAKAAIRAGVRAVLLIGKDQRNRTEQALPETVFVTE